MKNIFTTAFILIALTSFGQMQINHDGVSVGATYSVDSASGTGVYFKIDFYMLNNSGVSDNMSFTRYRNYHTSGWTDQICDDLICFNADNTTTWDRPNSPALNVANGDSSILQVKVYPNDIAGCAIYTYYIKDGAKNVQDSVQVTYTLDGNSCFASISDFKDIEYSVYPNPADDIVNIKVNNAVNNDQLKIFNVLGEEVGSVYLTNGVNEIRTSDLNNGVYFYSIIRNNEVVETKKIFIRH